MTTDDHATETLPAALARTVAERRDAPALVWHEDSGRQQMTWGEYTDRAGRVAAGLRAIGVRRGDHVVLLLRNRPEFHVVDTACMLVGAVSVSVYPSPSVESLAHVLDSCDAVVCVAENAVFLDRVRAAAARPGAPRPRLVGVDADTAGPDVTPLADLEGGTPIALDDAAGAAGPADPVTTLFTSGTTGAPKGVPLTHANLLFAARTLGRRMGVSLAGRPQLSYLPMAHIGERLATHYLHMVQGSTVTCCPDLARLPDVLRATAPHMLFGAPRMWERLHDQVTARLDTEPALRDAVADPRLPPARRRSLVRGVLAEFGLADVAVAIVGSAPLPRRVQRFWLDLDMPLADCYGQTESCGMGTWDPHDIVLGTCGRPFDGMEIMIAPPDGEVLVRGPAVFGGYHRDPQATAAALDADGWYHTGDLGRLDDGRNLVLTGRRDDLLVPTSGHGVHPAPIEDELRRIPVVGHAMVVGHGRPNLTAVLTLDPEAAAAWATEHGRAGADPAGDPDLRAVVDAGVAAVNEHRPGPERIRAHLVVDDVWPLASDLLTATGKMRRAGVAARYADAIEDLYAAPAR